EDVLVAILRDVRHDSGTRPVPAQLVIPVRKLQIPLVGIGCRDVPSRVPPVLVSDPLPDFPVAIPWAHGEEDPAIVLAQPAHNMVVKSTRVWADHLPPHFVRVPE